MFAYSAKSASSATGSFAGTTTSGTNSSSETTISGAGSSTGTSSAAGSSAATSSAAVSNSTNKLRVKFATLALSGEYFYYLLSGLDASVYGGPEAIRNGVVPGLLGFNKVICMQGLDIPGFVCEPSAIAFASRGFRPADDTPYRAIREIKEPESGLTLTLVEYGDGPSGDLSESVTTRIGAAVGDGDALVRLVSGASDD